MTPCACREPHPLKRVVLTGGPGAGKTAALAITRQAMCKHVVVLPESAGIVFGGGFPRRHDESTRRAAQRAIFHVQRELEAAAESFNPAIVLCDRGTIDGAAYWPGSDTLWSSVGVGRVNELERYDAVIHLCTPSAAQGYDDANQLRLETAEDAARVDARIALEWDGHPRVFTVEAGEDFVIRAARALDLVRAELPACCRTHPVPIPRLPTAWDAPKGTPSHLLRSERAR